MRRILALALLPLPCVAQDAPEAPLGWLGATPHLVMVGRIGGHPVEVRLPDMAAAEGVAAFSGKREYLPGEAAWRYGDFEVGLQATIDGVERSFELELENADFAAHPLPATFALGPGNFPEGLRAFLEASAEWETAEGSVNEEVGGWTGTLTLLVDSGTADAEGLSQGGSVGGFLVAESGGDRLVASFTVPVSDVEKDD